MAGEGPAAVFVYGTLMPGHLRWPALAPHARDHRRAAAPGVLYDSGLGWPAATFSFDAPTRVPGVLVDLRLESVTSLLAHLDEVEDVPGGLFARVLVTTDDGAVAWAWSHRGRVDHLTVIDAWFDQPEA